MSTYIEYDSDDDTFEIYHTDPWKINFLKLNRLEVEELRDNLIGFLGKEAATEVPPEA